MLRVFVLGLFAVLAQARVVKFEVVSTGSVLAGQSFGNTGSYERVRARVHFALNPSDPHNQQIVDLKNAENLRQGEVAFEADVMLIRPTQAEKGNGTLLVEVPNRGKSRFISLLDGGDWNLQSDAGDGWLLRQGYTIAAIGWQWDATGPDTLRLTAPVAKERGKTIEGLLRGDFTLAAQADEVSLGHLIAGGIGGTEYPVAAPDDQRNCLTVRTSREAERTVIPRSKWSFAHTVDGRLMASDRFIHLDGGFQKGLLYEYVYVVRDPVVAGLGFAAVRDLASFAKHQNGDIRSIRYVIGEGISQNGRFLRDFIYQGFNADEQGRPVLDGVLAHVAGAGRGSFNYRFAQPSRDAQPTSSVFYPTDVFPFTDNDERNPVTGKQDGLLDRARAEHVLPKIFFTNTSYEYWGRAASLIHTAPDGKHDMPISDSVRIYHLTGLQHFSVPFPPERGKADGLGQQRQSPLPVRYLWRALLTNMQHWVSSNEAPPPSRYPLLSNGSLVTLDRYKFPSIPGVNVPHDANGAYELNYGPAWQRGILSKQPPSIGHAYPVLVPQVDADGNEVDGVRLPEITVPLATYTGWNLRSPDIGAPDQRVAFEGSFLPLPISRTLRKSLSDPRTSVQERYANETDYMQRYAQALDELIKSHYLLAEDRDAMLQRGRDEWRVLAP